MKLTTWFIQHPVIAIIINCLIIMMGLLSFHNLSLREYPNISFPTISIKAVYPNASPELIETVVTNTLEDNLAGIEGLETITSQSQNGVSYITLVFLPGTPMDRALNATQDAVTLAMSFLPIEVKAPRIERQKQSSNGLPFMAIALESSSLGFGELTHFANLRLKNEFRSVTGVAAVTIWGQPYTWLVSLDPEKLYAFGINADEILSVITKGRVSMPAGNFQDKIPSSLNSELKSAQDLENLLIKSDMHHPVLLKSLAQVKLVTDDSRTRVRVNGHSGVVVAINKASDANPVEVSKLVQSTLKKIEKTLPHGIQAKLILDQSEFINASIKNIQSTIGEAIFLVLVIVFIFLRNIRSTLIPLITIPISLLGSLLFLKLFNFSINLMTLLAMVLAIGLVVDDAIVMLENIWRHIEKGEKPLDAAIKGAKEIGFAIIAMTFTLASVYMPIGFIQGMLGQLFIEFAVALAGSVVISGIVALTLSPLMCSRLLDKNTKPRFEQVDIFLSNLTSRYARRLQWVIKRQSIGFLAAFISIGLSVLIYYYLPFETSPKEDRGLVGISTPLLATESIDDLNAKVEKIERATNAFPEIQNKLSFVGEWGSYIILPLKPHNSRSRTANEVVNALKPKYARYPSVDPLVWSWENGLPGLDDAGSGRELSLVISTPETYAKLFKQVEKLKATLDKTHAFSATRFDLRLDSLGLDIQLNNNLLSRLGLTPQQVAKTIEIFFSGDRSQTFQKDGVVYSISVKSSRPPWTLNELYLTTQTGKRVSLGTFTEMKPKAQPAELTHYKQMRSTTMHAELRSDQSLPQAMNTLWETASSHLPAQYQLSWTGAAKSSIESSNTMLFLLFLSLIFIYAILAIQFENFTDPFIILFTVPLASSGALLATWFTHQTMNIYTQVGLITLIGLISKHGILIVEFANQLLQEGENLLEAIIKACVLRLRPILMTTGAMLFGAIPLILSHDAGAESRHAIGTVLIGGLFLGTFFTLFVLPTIYYLIKKRIPATHENVFMD